MGGLFDLKRKGYGSIASEVFIFTQCTSRIIFTAFARIVALLDITIVRNFGFLSFS